MDIIAVVRYYAFAVGLACHYSVVKVRIPLCFRRPYRAVWQNAARRDLKGKLPQVDASRTAIIIFDVLFPQPNRLWRQWCGSIASDHLLNLSILFSSTLQFQHI